VDYHGAHRVGSEARLTRQESIRTSDYNDSVTTMDDSSPDRHSVIESAEVMGPVFTEVVDYASLKKLTATDAFADLRARAAERSAAA
jgi:hypothetical protein